MKNLFAKFLRKEETEISPVISKVTLEEGIRAYSKEVLDVSKMEFFPSEIHLNYILLIAEWIVRQETNTPDAHLVKEAIFMALKSVDFGCGFDPKTGEFTTCLRTANLKNEKLLEWLADESCIRKVEIPNESLKKRSLSLSVKDLV